jgi:hypothetical protein
MYGSENPKNSLTANILTYQHKQECHTVSILCITTEGRLSIFIVKVLREGKRRDSLFVLHDSSCFSGLGDLDKSKHTANSRRKHAINTTAQE